MQRSGRLVAQVAGGLVRQGVAAFEDAGALDDPVGIEAEALVEMVVGDDGVGNVAAGAEDAHARQAAAARTGQWSAFFAHGIGTAWGEWPAGRPARAGDGAHPPPAPTDNLPAALRRLRLRRVHGEARERPAGPCQSPAVGCRGTAPGRDRRAACSRCAGCRPGAEAWKPPSEPRPIPVGEVLVCWPPCIAACVMNCKRHHQRPLVAP